VHLGKVFVKWKRYHRQQLHKGEASLIRLAKLFHPP
jgi:hypothetical protein